MSGMRVAVSWSGGKDSSLSLHRAAGSGLHCCHLLNMVDVDYSRSMSHGLDKELIAAQADAMQIPIVQKATSWGTYEREFKAALECLKLEGIQGMVFGDIDLAEHREWVERVCGEAGLAPILPLWGDAPETLLNEFIEAGFEAVVVAAKADLFDDEWLGKPVDLELVSSLITLSRQSGFHPCGEKGEYHTLVTDGPVFRKRINILQYRKVVRDGYRFLDISGYRVEDR